MSERTDELTHKEQAYFTTRGGGSLLAASGKDIPEAEESGSGNQQDPDTDSRRRTVPHAALHAEREEHKKTRAELQLLRRQAMQMHEEFRRVMSALHQKAGEADAGAPPDPGEDFLGFTRWQVEQINDLRQQLAENRRRTEDDRKLMQAEQALWSEWERSVDLARDEHGDFDEALNFLEKSRDRQLAILAQVDPRYDDRNFRRKQLRAELRDMLVTAYQQGKDPAKAAYAIARAYGYDGASGGKLAQLDQAQSASRTLAAGSGREAGDPMLLETVADLPEEEFASWYENNRDTFRKMFGG